MCAIAHIIEHSTSLDAMSLGTPSFCR